MGVILWPPRTPTLTHTTDNMLKGEPAICSNIEGLGGYYAKVLSPWDLSKQRVEWCWPETREGEKRGDEAKGHKLRHAGCKLQRSTVQLGPFNEEYCAICMKVCWGQS